METEERNIFFKALCHLFIVEIELHYSLKKKGIEFIKRSQKYEMRNVNESD